MKKTKPMRLSPAILDKVWRDWLAANNPTFSEKIRYLDSVFPASYKSARKCNKSEKFESWLFREYGATVRQVAGKCHLEFSQPERASWFLLKY